jgi:hypothetical protein
MYKGQQEEGRLGQTRDMIGRVAFAPPLREALENEPVSHTSWATTTATPCQGH